MRIDPSNLASLSGSIPTAATTKASGSKEGKPSDAVADTGFSPTADLTRLLQAVKDMPDIRADVVQEL